MTKTLIASFTLALAMLAGSSAVSAQDADMKVLPIELFTCSYNDGMGPEDLDAAADKWNAWADKNGVDDYAAWTLTPYYFGPNQEFDVIWLGAGKSGAALGKAQDDYIAEDAGLHDAFNEVLSCDAHGNFASVMYKAPPKGKTPENSVLTFSDCTYKDGATFSALGAAMGEWSQHLTDSGSVAGVWHWYPVYGGGGEEFSFKWLEAFPNLASLGSDFDNYTTGGGYKTSGNLFRHLIDCDSARAYLAKSRRYVQLR